MESLPGTAPDPSWAKSLIWDATPPFHIRWISTTETRFSWLAHLKNDFYRDEFGEPQAVFVGRDGQEIEPGCGKALCQTLDEQKRRMAGGSRPGPGVWSGAEDRNAAGSWTR